jgi:L-asparaginase II
MLISDENGKIRFIKSDKNKEIKIPSSCLKEFSRLIMVGTQTMDAYDTTNWTKQEKLAYKFAKKLVHLYA